MDKDSKALIARIQRYTTQDIDELMEDCVHSIERLNAENARLREVLKQYACECSSPCWYPKDISACGMTARTAIAKNGEE